MNPLYSIIKLILATLYPAYASFKAVKEKNVKEYVKWMMYWIVFAGFTAVEAIVDTLFSFWFPFYQESKIVVLLWLLSPATRGSSLLYRRFIHPALLRRENDIDNMILGLQEQGYRTMAGWSRACIQYVTTAIMQTAIQGGGGIIQHLKSSYILADVASLENVSTIDRRLRGTKHRTQGMQRRHISQKHDAQFKKGDIYFSEVDSNVLYGSCRQTNDSIFSSSSVSSGYSSMSPISSFSSDESFLPVSQDTMDTDNYELFDARLKKQPSQISLQQHKEKQTRKEEVLLPLDEDEDTFYESVETPFGFPLQHSSSAPITVVSRSDVDFSAAQDNATHYYPEDRDSSPEENSHFEDDVSVIENIRFPIYSGGTGVRIMEIREDKLQSFQHDITKQHLIVNKSKDSTDGICTDLFTTNVISSKYQKEISTEDGIKTPSIMETQISKNPTQTCTTSELNLTNSHEKILVATSKLPPNINVEASPGSKDSNLSSTLPPTPPPRRGESSTSVGHVSRLTHLANNQMEDFLRASQEHNEFSNEAHNQIIQEKPIQFPCPPSHDSSTSSINIPFRESSPSNTSGLQLSSSSELVTLPQYSTPGTTSSHSMSKCPHCFIHSWLPHSLNCPKLKLNKNK